MSGTWSFLDQSYCIHVDINLTLTSNNKVQGKIIRIDNKQRTKSLPNVPTVYASANVWNEKYIESFYFTYENTMQKQWKTNPKAHYIEDRQENPAVFIYYITRA